jgi:hypothetical protein
LKNLPKTPNLFFCEKDKEFFFSYSKLKKPTHSKCTTHNTRLATNKEIDELNKTNKTNYPYNKLGEN